LVSRMVCGWQVDNYAMDGSSMIHIVSVEQRARRVTLWSRCHDGTMLSGLHAQTHASTVDLANGMSGPE